MPSDEYNEGKRFALTHGALYRNPYPIGSAKYNEFERGWTQTLKRHPQEVARAEAARKAADANEQRREAERVLRVRDSYRRMKGED